MSTSIFERTSNLGDEQGDHGLNERYPATAHSRDLERSDYTIDFLASLAAPTTLNLKSEYSCIEVH
jgi:hypothetical protein